MPSASSSRFSPRGLSLRTKSFLLIGLPLLALTAVGFAAAVGPENTILWAPAAIFCVLTATSFLAIEFLFIRKILRLENELRLAADRASRLPDPPLSGRSQNQEALLLSVLDSASEGIMAFRSLRNEKGSISDFILVLANKAAGAMMNRESKAMLGKCLLGLFPGNLSVGLFDRYVRVVETNVGEQLEAFDGHEDVRSWFHISVQPWSDGFVVTFEEISQRKHVEQELQASVEEMERFNRAMIGRENRVLEMKSEVNHLRSRLGLPPEYKVDSLSDEP